MGVGSELQELGRFLDDCERRAEAVDSLNVVEVTGVGDQRLTADLELRLSVDSLSADGTNLCDPRVGPDGTVRFALEPATGLPLSTDHDVNVTPTDVALDADDCVRVTLAATVPADASESGDIDHHETAADELAADDATDTTSSDTRSAGAVTGADRGSDTPAVTGAGGATDTDRATDAVHTEGSDDASDASDANDTHDVTVAGASGPDDSGADEAGDTETPGSVETDDALDGDTQFEVAAALTKREVPPFKDPELLADVYESCDTFAQMAEEIDMDVTGETVRRYMIQHDIHEPTSYQTSGDNADAQPVALADGIGLPDDVTVETLTETVKNSNTIHQVKRDIDIEREDALEMLKELNLLDLVVGRLATEGEREITREDVIECLREASAVQ